MLFSQRISIDKFFFTGLIAIVVIISCVHWGEWYFHRTQDFENEINELTKNYLAQQKEIISREVDSAIEFARFQHRQLEEDARLEIKERVNEAHNMISNLYQYYKNKKTDAEILELVSRVNYLVRFDDN